MSTGVSATHGTYAKYQRGCRCDDCRTASNAYMAEWRARNKGILADPADERHGTVNGYDNFGCRCMPCRQAHRAQNPPGGAITQQLRRWFRFGAPHPFVGGDLCLVCDQPSHPDGERRKRPHEYASEVMSDAV